MNNTSTNKRDKHSIVLTVIVLLFIMSILFAIRPLLTMADNRQVATVSGEQEVNISITPKPKIDIVLAKARSKVDVNSFEEDIKNALRLQGVDPGDVNVSAVSAQQENMETAFTWESDVSTTIGTLRITNNGQNVEMIGNREYPGKNAIWIEPDGNQEQKFTFDYSINFGDSFNAAGMLLRVKETDNTTHTLSGYMLSFNNSNWKNEAGGSNGAIWQFVYDGNNNSNMQKTLIEPLTINTSGTLTVSATDSKITISGGGLASEVSCNIDSEYTTGNGFGFFSDHYSHNCDSLGSFKLTGINLQTVSTKSFNEVLRLPQWRENSIRFLVNVDDYTNEELYNQTAYSEILTRLISEDIYFNAWGNIKNKEQFENLINANNKKGKFIDNTNYDNAITDTAKYIKSILGSQDSSQYVIVNEAVSINVTPSGITENTIDQEWPYGKWKINHDYLFYENNIGQFAESGKLINNLITTFDKTGKYEILYKNIPVSPRQIYVHRRPVAQINLQRNGNNITLTSDSYDTDQLSTANKGISQEEWKWKTSEEANWHNGKITNVSADKDYTIQLRVKDNQNTWSSYAIQYITSSLNALPVASFNITNPSITNYERLEIQDASYDPAGGSITSYLWEVYKDRNLIYSGSEPKLDYPTEQIGTYTMYLTVTNSRGKTSERFGRTFEIIRDELAPEVIVNPIHSDWVNEQTIHLEFSDQGGSRFKSYRYQITNSQKTPTTWSSPISRQEDDITINTEGEKYLHIIAEDNAGNISTDRITGPYKIDRTAPSIEVIGDLTTPNGKGVKVTFNIVDSLSGINQVRLDGNVITNSSYTFTTNGSHVIEAEDNLGHINSKSFTVTGAYYECPEELGHPIFNSDIGENCPICESFEGLRAVKESKVYNGLDQGIGYVNPKDAILVEYYDGSTGRKTDVGDYEYELKVVYNERVYNTGIKGIFSITKKGLEVIGINAEDRKYNKTDIVNIAGGTLVGVIEGDIVTAIIPSVGKTETKDVGTWKVQLDNITLQGEDSNNYSVVQPEYGTITATISKKDVTIENIVAENRKYNKTDIVNITGGTLVGVVEGDDVTAIVPSVGKTEDVNIGTWKVQLDNITLAGEDSKNYELIQPEYGTITATITKKDITIENVKAQDRAYNATDIVQITGGDLVGVENEDDVTAIVPDTGKSESINIGTWKVQLDNILLEGEDIRNYELIQPEYGTILVKISKKELTIENIDAEDRKYNKTDIVNITGGTLVGVVEGDDVTAIIPSVGKTETEDVGTWKVQLDNITLQGEDSNDYSVVQPEYGTITATISKKDVTIENIVAENRKYNKTDIVNITGGTLVGVVEGDDVTAIIPSIGKTETEDVGTWKVELANITLEGEDSKNYELIQPEYGTITATITKKDITIENVKAQDRAYNATDIVKITGGDLVGVENEDDVTAIVPDTGKSESINIGTWKVQLDNILLEGEDSKNYELIQPEYGTILVKISKKELTIENIDAKDRYFDTTDVVQIIEGNLVGVEDGDEVLAITPKSGKSESIEPGEWKVEIKDIVLEGKDSSDYSIIQPEYGSITVTISEAPAYLTIGCESKLFDRKEPEPFKIDSNNKSDVTYTYYNHGEDEPIQPPTKIGVYDVIGTVESDGQYQKAISNKVTFEIQKPLTPKMHLESYISKINDEEIGDSQVKTGEISVGQMQYIKDGKVHEIRKDDTIIIDLVVYNESMGGGYVNTIENIIPEGTEFIKDNKINLENGWKKIKDRTYLTEKLSLENSIENEIPGLEDTDNNMNISSKKVQIALKVTAGKTDSTNLYNKAIITQTDISGANINIEKNDGISTLNMSLCYADLQIATYVGHINQFDIQKGEKIEYDVSPRDITKIDLPTNMVSRTKMDVTFKIAISNIGADEAELEGIVNFLPEKLEYIVEENPDWLLVKEGIIQYNKSDKIMPGETKTLSFICHWNGSQKNLGNMLNKVVVLSNDDIEQKEINDKSASKLTQDELIEKLKDTNNASQTTLLVTIRTGQVVFYISVVFAVALSIAIGIFSIKKWIL